MAIRDNQDITIQIVPNQLGPRAETPGTLLGDTLNIVSPSFKGPAFVPQNVSGREELADLIGTERQNIYGHLYDQLHYYVPNQGFDALGLWFDNGGQSAVHTRILGIGNGIKNAETGKYEGSGFKIGENEGMHFVFTTYGDKTLEESSTYLSELGLDTNEDHYFLSHVVFTPETVSISFNGTDDLQEINEINISEASLKYSKPGLFNFKTSNNFLGSLKNTKPTNSNAKSKDNLFETKLADDYHYLYTKHDFDIRNSRISISSKIKSISGDEDLNYKSFEDIYQTAKTPWVVSQPYDRTTLSDNREDIYKHVHELFRFWALDDGEVGNRYKIKISPKSRGNSNSSIEDFSRFDIYFFEYDARVNQFTLLETYEDVTLDVDDNNYIGRRIGTKRKFFDLETNKVYVDGLYDNVSRHLRVEINEKVENKDIPKLQSFMPSGFRAYPHIDCSNIENNDSDNLHAFPVKFYERYNNVSEIDGLDNTWGVQMYRLSSGNVRLEIASPSIRIENNVVYQDENHDFISPHYYHTKFYSEDNIIQDDSYLNNFFHLEKISYKDNISSGRYKDSGLQSSLDDGYKYLNLDELTEDELQDFVYQLSFDFFTFGGFDGVDILDFNKKYMTNNGLMTEYYNESNSTVLSAYKKGIDQITKYENCNGTILSIPDTSTELIHKYCIERIESLTRYIYVGDIKELAIDFTENIDSTNLLLPRVYYNIENKLSNYVKDENYIVPFALEDNIEKLEYIVNNQIFPSYDSKYFFNTMCDFTYVITNNETNDAVPKVITSPTFVTSLMARSNSLRLNISQENINTNSSLGQVSDYAFNDILKLNAGVNLTEKQAEKIKNTLFVSNINAFTANSGINKTRPGLLTAHTYTGSEFSILRKLNITRTVQLIKNSIMIDLYTNESIIPGTVLFNNSSKINSIYQKIRIQLEILMQSFIDRDLISGYRVNIDPNYINNNFNDIVNHKLKGNIIIQFGQSNIIELDIDSVLSELNETLASDNIDNKVVLPRVV